MYVQSAQKQVNIKRAANEATCGIPVDGHLRGITGYIAYVAAPGIGQLESDGLLACYTHGSTHVHDGTPLA